MAKLQGLVAVVTGAGSGIGRASAVEFAREGARVVAADLNAASAAETADQILSAGGQAESVEVDVTQASQVERMVRTAVDKFGRLDVLYNNAGLAQAPGPFEASTDALYDRIFDVN